MLLYESENEKFLLVREREREREREAERETGGVFASFCERVKEREDGVRVTREETARKLSTWSRGGTSLDPESAAFARHTAHESPKHRRSGTTAIRSCSCGKASPTSRGGKTIPPHAANGNRTSFGRTFRKQPL